VETSHIGFPRASCWSHPVRSVLRARRKHLDGGHKWMGCRHCRPR
jgi:hypothetical protein